MYSIIINNSYCNKLWKWISLRKLVEIKTTTLNKHLRSKPPQAYSTPRSINRMRWQVACSQWFSNHRLYGRSMVDISRITTINQRLLVVIVLYRLRISHRLLFSRVWFIGHSILLLLTKFDILSHLIENEARWTPYTREEKIFMFDIYDCDQYL